MFPKDSSHLTSESVKSRFSHSKQIISRAEEFQIIQVEVVTVITVKFWLTGVYDFFNGANFGSEIQSPKYSIENNSSRFKAPTDQSFVMNMLSGNEHVQKEFRYQKRKITTGNIPKIKPILVIRHVLLVSTYVGDIFALIKETNIR